jgi:hypothetical protein
MPGSVVTSCAVFPAFVTSLKLHTYSTEPSGRVMTAFGTVVNPAAGCPAGNTRCRSVSVAPQVTGMRFTMPRNVSAQM